MGENWGSWFPRQQFGWQPHDLNNLYSHMEHHHTMPSLVKRGADMVSVKQTLPVYPSFEPPYSHVAQANEPHGWFYGMPRFRQAVTRTLNVDMEEKLITAPCENIEKSIAPKVAHGCSQKKFLVFDQSGDQTTLIFSSGTGTPVPCISFWDPKPTSACNLKREDHGTKENLNVHFGGVAADQFRENDGGDLKSEMHEDTDELNALLYSDDDSDEAEDDEVNSTGHSPSAMTVHNTQDWIYGSTEEVASSDGSTKKRKSSDGGYYETPALMDTASSAKPIRNFEYEDDAESRCDNGMNSASDEMGSEWSNKRIRKERIRDTVNVLQNIIPGGKGKDAIVVLDEAINYLKTLKLKARTLGLDAP